MAIALGLSTVFMGAPTAMAAPIWIERNFVPKAELIDPAFARRDTASVATIDHRAWTVFLDAYLVETPDGVNRVRYGAVTPADTENLDQYINSLAAISPAAYAPDVQLAYWINLYNAATIRLILTHYPLSSIQDIDDPWDQPVATVDGRALTLNDIEHGIIRPVFQDNRIHYAVNCASIGCPNLAPQAFTGARLDTMLDAAARAYISHPRGVRTKGRKAVLSKIFGWYQEDFGDNRTEVLAHLRQYADDDAAAALAAVRRITGYNYDWSLNDAAE